MLIRLISSQVATIVGLCIVKSSVLDRLETLIAIRDKEIELMRKKLLITTALVAAFTATNAYAKIIDTLPEDGKDGFQGNVFVEEHTSKKSAINYNADYLTDDEITIKNIYMQTLYGTPEDRKGMDVGEKVNDGSANTQKLVVTDDARLDINRNQGPDDSPENAEKAQNLFNVNGGTVELNNGELHADGIIKITDGNITLNGSEFIAEDAGAKLVIEGGTINVINGNERFNGIGVEITEDNPQEGLVEAAWGPVEMSGGTINVSGQAGKLEFTDTSVGNYLIGSEINISDGTLNINDNSGVTVTKGFKNVDENDIATLEKGSINLTNTGVINLSGSLISNVEGDGNLNVKSSNALVDGNVSGSNLTFEADHTLSQAISGTIGDLASLNVNKGTLNFDEQTGLIDEVNIAENAGLHVDIKGNGPEQENVQLTANSFTSSGNIELAFHSDITAQNNLEINGGSVAAVNGDLESFNTININGGTLNLSDSSDITALKGLNISGGEINISDGEIWSLGDINLKDGTVNLSNLAAITTDFDDLDGIFNDTQKPETAGNINITGSSVNVEDKALLISEGNINLNGTGVIDVQDGATLFTTKTLPDEVEESDLTAFIKDNKATINLTDTGMANISGTLLANVEGNGKLNINSSSAKVDGDVSGSNLTFEENHSLSNAISGTIGNLASLNVNNGTLAYDKQTGKIGNLNVANGAGLDIGTNTVNATTATFADNSNLALRVASTRSFGNITADNITIGKDTTMKVTLDNGVVDSTGSETFKFLNSENIEGSFTNKIAENSRYDIKWNEDGSLSIFGKDVTSSDIVADAGGTSSNASTAEAWESIDDSSDVSEQAKNVSNVLYTLSQDTSAAGKKAYTDALTTVAPEVAPMVQHTQTQTANQVFGAVGTRLTGGSVSTGGQGMSSGDNIFERAALWVQGLFNKSKLEDTSKSYGFDADSSGIAMGAEKYVTEDTKIGLGYAYTNTDIDGFMRSTDVDTHTAFVYGEYKPSNWYVNGIASYGWSDYSENKNVSGVGVKADYDAETFGLQAMTGYDMQLKHFGLTPEVGLRYVHISQDGYKDSADQRVSSSDSDILTGVIGAKVSKTWRLENGMNIKPEARIAATYDLMNDDVNSVVTLANGSAYMVEGDALDRFGMEFGAGVTAEVNDNVELSLGYEGKFREDYQDHTGLVNLKYKF